MMKNLMGYMKSFRISALAMFLTILMVALVPLGVLAQNEVEIGLGGPYVDEIVWEIFGSDEAALMAFLRGDTDMPAGFTATDIQVMAADPNVEIVKAPGALSFIFLVINVRGPAGNYSTPGAAEALNDVRFRKALAHMVDRQALKDLVWGDNLELYDSVVPSVYGDWVNPNVTRYEHSFARANEILDEAGYLDVDGDGFRETPSNETLKIELAAIVTLSDCVKAARFIEAWAEAEVGLDIEVITPDRTWVGTNVFTGKFDMWIITMATRATQSGPESVLMSSFYSPKVDYMDFSGWENATFQAYVDNMTSTLNETLAKEYCWKAQEVESDAVPVINIGQYIPQHAYRTDEFIGWVSEPGKGVSPSYWNWLNVRSKTQMGGVVHVPLTSEPGKTTFCYYRTSGHAFPYLINEPLFLPSGPFEYKPTPRLAKSWSFEEATVAGEPGMVITFNLVDNATWHDGEPFTSADVKYTLDYLNENRPVVMFGFYANKGWIDHVETPDNYTVKVYINRQSLFAVPGIGLCPILPKHIWENRSWTEWDPIDGPHVGTGPWMFKDRVIGEYIRYKRNPNYYYQPAEWPPTPPPAPPPPVTVPWHWFAVGIIVVVVIAVGAVIVARKRKGS
jgi:ABC-type transport system substrate-binding protein